MAKYRIISIDGGGIRGLVTAILLQKIAKVPELVDFLDKADLIAGTSTGGLLALGIAKGLSPAEFRDLYVNKGKQIFDDSWLDDLVDLGKLRGADYDSKFLRRELKKIFQSTTLGDLPKKVLITSFDLDNEDTSPQKRTWKPKLFHNFDGPSHDKGTFVADVGMFTTAAPTYFPSYDGYVDGGVYANNPAMCALAQTQDERYPPNHGLKDIVMFSLGTGTSLQYVKGKSHDWGYAQWVKPLINLMMDGTAGIADYQCHQLLGNRYHRLAPVFPAGMNIPLDAVAKIPEMVSFAERYDVSSAVDWLKKHWL
jgi:uncharacterized protein